MCRFTCVVWALQKTCRWHGGVFDAWFFNKVFKVFGLGRRRFVLKCYISAQSSRSGCRHSLGRRDIVVSGVGCRGHNMHLLMSYLRGLRSVQSVGRIAKI